MKYKILENKRINHNGRTLYRIQALKSFSNVKAGDLGGFIESNMNLSQSDNCWIYDNAKVYDRATIQQDAQIRDSAEVFDSAEIEDSARIYNNAKVYGAAQVNKTAEVREWARVFDTARVLDRAEVFGWARVFENSEVYNFAAVAGCAQVRGRAAILNNARVCGNALIDDCAIVGGNAIVDTNAQVLDYAKVRGGRVTGNAVLQEQQEIYYGVVDKDISKDLKENIRVQTGLGVFNNKVIAYKQVQKNLCSFYDVDFKYMVGEVIEAPGAELSNQSCAAGLHFSNMNYWNTCDNINTSTFLMAEIDLDDIITVQQGKIRCKRAKILGTYDIA